MGREIPFGTGGISNVVLRHNNDKLAIRVVMDHNAAINRFLVLFNYTGATYQNDANTSGYADGTGGTIRLRICPMISANGNPDLANTVASETITAQDLFNRRTEYAGVSSTSQGSFFLPRTPGGAVWTHPSDTPYWYVIDNVDSNTTANWISWNGNDARPSNEASTLTLGPNGVNYPYTARPAGSYAIAGLDPREVVAWTTSGDNGPWVYCNVGGLEGQSRANRPGFGTTGYYSSPKYPMYGWTEIAGTNRFKVGQPFGYDNPGGRTGTNLYVDNVKRSVTVTHVGAVHGNPGTITFYNLTTAQSSTCSSFTSSNNGMVYRGALITPIVVNTGDNIHIQSTTAIQAHEFDASVNPFVDVGDGRTWNWTGAASAGVLTNAAQLFADPWPDFEETAAPPPPPPTTQPMVQVIETDTAQTFSALPSIQLALGTMPMTLPLGRSYITNGAINGPKIADNSISTSKIQDAQITTAKIADSQITTGKIVDLAVTAGKMANSTITVTQIADNAVTTAKINAAAVTPAKWATVPAARVYRNAALNHTSTGNFQSVSFDTESYDTDTMVDIAGNATRITIKTAGLYRFSGRAFFSTGGAGTVRSALVLLNGATTIDRGDEDHVSGGYLGAKVGGTYSFAVNDYIEIQGYQDSGGNLAYVVGTGFLHFSCEWIGPAS